MIQPSGALEHAKRLRELAQSVAGQPKEPDYYGEFNKAAITIEELAEQLAAAMAENEKLRQALYREGTIRTDLGGNKTYTNIDQKGGE